MANLLTPPQIYYALTNLNGKPADGALFPSSDGCWIVQNRRGVLALFAGELRCLEYRVFVVCDKKVHLQDFYHPFKPPARVSGGELVQPMLTITADDIFKFKVKIFQFSD